MAGEPKRTLIAVIWGKNRRGARQDPAKFAKCGQTSYNEPMKIELERVVLTVCRHDGVWAVEEEGRYFAHSADKDIVKASANKRAREMQDGGRPCLVRVSGEHGFFTPAA